MPFEAQVQELQSGAPLVAVSFYLQINSTYNASDCISSINKDAVCQDTGSSGMRFFLEAYVVSILIASS